MKDPRYTRRTTLQRLATSLTVGSLFAGNAVGSVAGATDGPSSARLAQDVPTFYPTEEGETFTLTGRTEGWTNHIEDPFGGWGDKYYVEYDQDASTSGEARMWLHEKHDNAATDITQTAGIGFPVDIALGQANQATLIANTTGMWFGAVEIPDEDITQSSTVDVTGSLGFGPLDVVDPMRTPSNTRGASGAVTEVELFSERITPGTKRIFSNPDAHEQVTVTIPYSRGTTYVVYYNLHARSNLEEGAQDDSTVKMSFSPSQNAPTIETNREQEDSGLHLDEAELELVDLYA